MEEKEYLRQGNVLVTSTRIEIYGQTFAVRNVGSVKVMRPGLPWIAGFLFLVGLVLLPVENARYAGLGVMVVSGVWIWQQVRMRTLVLVTGGGETVALKSTKGDVVETVRSAVAQAISAR